MRGKQGRPPITETQFREIIRHILITDALGQYDSFQTTAKFDVSDGTVRNIKRAENWEQWNRDKAARLRRAYELRQEPGAGASVAGLTIAEAAEGYKTAVQDLPAGLPLVGVAPTPPRPEAKRPLFRGLFRRTK